MFSLLSQDRRGVFVELENHLFLVHAYPRGVLITLALVSAHVHLAWSQRSPGVCFPDGALGVPLPHANRNISVSSRDFPPSFMQGTCPEQLPFPF